LKRRNKIKMKAKRKVVMRGMPGNKWKSYEIMYEGKT